jgi:tRNA 2-thiouridine synthesizing protein A
MTLVADPVVGLTVGAPAPDAAQIEAGTGPRTVDARSRVCPAPLLELIDAIREAEIGDLIAVLSSDVDSRSDIPKWIQKAGHRLIGVTARAGFDEIVVQKMG